MNKITKESEIFTAQGITKIEKLRKAKYVCETCISVNGEWANQPVAIFYGQAEHPVSKSRYFGLYVNEQDQVMVINGQTAVDEPITGVIADDGEIIYSRYKQDFRKSKDGSVFVDGGRDHIRSPVLSEDRYVKLIIVDGDFKVDDTTTPVGEVK
tara:strand:- start:2906 stop:3367 length:462 start_codon:yes stop_codon:yes gene_type:complete